MLVISAESHHHLGPLQPLNMGKNDTDMSNLQQIGQTLTTRRRVARFRSETARKGV